MANGFVSFAEVKRAVSMEALLSRYELLDGLSSKGANLVGACPFCNGGSARQFQVSFLKNVWYCFGCKEGGNVLDFVAKKEKLSLRAAALALDKRFELGLAGEAPRPKLQQALSDAPLVREELLPTENPPLAFTLKTLDTQHLSLAALGFQASTVERFGAGYCTKGLLKGRLAIPIHNASGELVAYAGLTVGNLTPRYLFPPKFHPELEVMNLHRLEEFAEQDGPLYLAPEIEGVLRLADVGCAAAIGLFDGSLSFIQEQAIARVAAAYERLVLVGDGFPERTAARLARHVTLSWVAKLPVDLLA